MRKEKIFIYAHDQMGLKHVLEVDKVHRVGDRLIYQKNEFKVTEVVFDYDTNVIFITARIVI